MKTFGKGCWSWRRPQDLNIIKENAYGATVCIIFIVLPKDAAQSTLKAKNKRLFNDRNDVGVETFCQITWSKSQKLKQKTVCCLFRLTRSSPSLSIFEYTQLRKAEDNSQPHSLLDFIYLLFIKGAITELIRIFVSPNVFCSIILC